MLLIASIFVLYLNEFYDKASRENADQQQYRWHRVDFKVLLEIYKKYKR